MECESAPDRAGAGHGELRQVGTAALTPNRTILNNRYRNFSKGEAVDYVETDKSLIVLHELEKNWWILAVSLALRNMP